MTASLAATDQEFYQKGNRHDAVGGDSSDPSTGSFRAYDTLYSIIVSAHMDTVVRGRTAPGSVKQIHDPRFAVTGGDMGGIVPLVKLQGATTVGYIYGGIISAATNAQGESTASNVVFKVVITPA